MDRSGQDARGSTDRRRAMFPSTLVLPDLAGRAAPAQNAAMNGSQMNGEILIKTTFCIWYFFGGGVFFMRGKRPKNYY